MARGGKTRQGYHHLLHLTARGEQRPGGAFTEISGSEYGQSPAWRSRRLARRRLPHRERVAGVRPPPNSLRVLHRQVIYRERMPTIRASYAIALITSSA